MESGQYSDGQLLSRYHETGDEPAFAELVRRHLNLVHGAALRQTANDHALAQDVAQQVFVEMARQSAGLLKHPTLAGWLYITTRNIAGHARRQQDRRSRRELATMSENTDHSRPSTPDGWDNLRPILDDAMAELSEKDRLAILLRYFEDQDLKQVGSALGLGDNAARMRVQRALEKLKALLERKGITTSTAGLGLLLTTHAATAAPSALSLQITAAAGLAASAKLSVTSGTVALTSLAMKSPTILGLTAAIIVAPLIYQEHLIRKARTELSEIPGLVHSINAPLASAGQEGYSQTELDKLRAESAELADLRNEVTRIQTELGVEKQTLLANATRDLLAAEAAVQAAKEETESRALRTKTINFMKMLGLAARVHATDNQDQFPTSFDQISKILSDSLPKDLSLDRFEFYPQSRQVLETEPQLILFHEKEPRKLPDGSWEKVYGLADGSVQTARSTTGDFSKWEQESGGIAKPLPVAGDRPQ